MKTLLCVLLLTAIIFGGAVEDTKKSYNRIYDMVQENAPAGTNLTPPDQLFEEEEAELEPEFRFEDDRRPPPLHIQVVRLQEAMKYMSRELRETKRLARGNARSIQGQTMLHSVHGKKSKRNDLIMNIILGVISLGVTGGLGGTYALSKTHKKVKQMSVQNGTGG